MEAPHMEVVIKINNTVTNKQRQGTLDTVPLMSSRRLTCCVGGGWIRSRVERKVMISRIKATKAYKVIVCVQPCWIFPSSPPNLFTKGSVNPCTTNCARLTAMKRTALILVRSWIFPVITPPREE